MVSKKMKMSRPGRGKAVTRQDVVRLIESRQEHKRFPLVSTTNSNNTTGTVINLSNGIIQGDNITERTGNTIRLLTHTLHVRASAITVNQTFRFIYFKDMDNRGTTPGVSEVLNTASFMSQYAPSPLQQRRFVILNDFSLDCSINGESIKSKRIVRKGYDVFFNGATAVSASNGPGATFLLVIGDSLTGLYDIAWEAIFTDS